MICLNLGVSQEHDLQDYAEKNLEAVKSFQRDSTVSHVSDLQMTVFQLSNKQQYLEILPEFSLAVSTFS